VVLTLDNIDEPGVHHSSTSNEYNADSFSKGILADAISEMHGSAINNAISRCPLLTVISEPAS